MAISPQIILSHSGKQHSYHLAKTLNDLNYLKRFYTSTYFKSITLQKFSETQNLHFFKKRFLEGLHGSVIKTNFFLEVKEVFARWILKDKNLANTLIYKRDIKFDLALAKSLGQEVYDVYWGYLGSCLQSLKTANEQQKISVCNMTSSYLPFAKKIVAEELNLYPQWADTLDVSFLNVGQTRLIEEPVVASHIVANSEFLKSTLTSFGINEQKITIIPLGVDINRISFNSESSDITKRPLRLLYAGKVSITKGIQYLLEAIKAFKSSDVELHIVGDIWKGGSEFKKSRHLYSFNTAINQQKLFKIYKNFDVFIFPSLMESYGNVLIEAQAAGLPIIATSNSIAPNIIKKENGRIVNIRDSNALIEAIAYFRGLDNYSYQQMRVNARKSAEQHSWMTYKENVNRFIKTLAVGI